MLENRKSPRTKMVLPVKVCIDKDTHLAHTIDITPTGARLGALRQQLQVGTIVTLQRGSKKAKFRIAWVRQLAATEVHAGIEALEPQEEFWGVSLSNREYEDKEEMQAFLRFLRKSSTVSL
jgi:PilZ domain